jgi:hypothetical protein
VKRNENGLRTNAPSLLAIDSILLGVKWAL